jgi:adenylate cyclase, class 2
VSRTEPAGRNVELKAEDPDPGRSLDVCRALGAADHGVIQQRDTYFTVGHGGLKLREESPGRPHLIQFERADWPEQRRSTYRIVEVEDGNMLRAALEAALGVRGVVEKRRHLFLWQQVRIHLDEVRDLGCFIELEAVAPAESDLSREHQLVAELREAFAISDDHLCATGYAGQLRI